MNVVKTWMFVMTMPIALIQTGALNVHAGQDFQEMDSIALVTANIILMPMLYYTKLMCYQTIDINECDVGTDSCNSTVSVCNNTLGGFNCVCRSGFNMTTDQNCIRKYSIDLICRYHLSIEELQVFSG